MEKEKFVVNISGDKLEIWEGKLAEPLPLRESQKIHLIGDIRTIAQYVAVRRDTSAGIQVIDPKTVIVEVDKQALQMVMKLNPEDYYGATVTASLEMANEVKVFGINTTKRYSRKQLHDLIKFNRLYFEDRNEHVNVLAGLERVRFKTNTEIEQASNSKGNKTSNYDQNTTTDPGFIDKFKLSIPLYKGFDKENIEVEICYDVLDGAISFWLESVGMKDAMASQVDIIFEEQLECCGDYVVIYK